MKKFLKPCINCCIALFAIIILGVMAAPGITTKVLGKTSTLSCYEAFLGAEDGWKASFGGVMALILVIFLVILPIVNIFIKIFVKDKKLNMIVTCAIAACAVIAAIFFFCGTTTLMLNVSKDGMKVLKAANLGLGAGAIVNGIFCIICGAAAAVNQFVLKD